MATPPSVISTQQTAWDSAPASYVLTAITTQVGDVLVILAQSADSANTFTSLPTMTGTAETWTKRQDSGAAGTSRVVGWTCVCTAAQSTTITVLCTANSTLWGAVLGQYRGSAGIGATTATNSGVSSTACSMTLTTTGANSMIAMQFSDWNANDGATRTWRTVDGVVLTETAYFRNTTDYAVYAGRDLDSAAAGAKTLGLSVPSTMRWSGVAVEVLGGAGAPPYPFGVTTPTPRYR